MSYLEFPKVLTIEAADTSEKLYLGGIKPSKSGELQYVTLNMFKHGVLPGTVAVKMGLHLNTSFASAYAFSTEFFLSDVETEIATSGDWLSITRFTFARPNLNKNSTYYLTLQTSGYTRSGDTFYIGAVRDNNFPVTSTVTPTPIGQNGQAYPAQFSAFMYVLPE